MPLSPGYPKLSASLHGTLEMQANATAAVDDIDDIEEDAQQIPINICGMEGYAESSSCGWGYHGRWASHTGYRHMHMSSDDTENIQETARSLYEEQRTLCYLVGDEHKDFGWKTVRVNLDGLVEIRLPQWASQVVKDSLLSIGVTLSCPLNCYWVFPKGVAMPQAKEVMEPLLQPNTRFADENELSSRLIANYPTTVLGVNEVQLSLF